MSAETDLVKLYSGRILALTTEIPHQQRLEAPSATVKRRAPLCGSTVTVDVVVEDGRITRYGQDVKACALGQAAAAIVGKNVIGTDRVQIVAGLAPGDQVATSPLDELADGVTVQTGE